MRLISVVICIFIILGFFEQVVMLQFRSAVSSVNVPDVKALTRPTNLKNESSACEIITRKNRQTMDSYGISPKVLYKWIGKVFPIVLLLASYGIVFRVPVSVGKVVLAVSWIL